MRVCKPNEEPHEVFQVAFGTSGGGLCALMIGRLAMPLQTSIAELERVCRDVFQNGWTWGGRFTGGTLGWPKYSTHSMEQAIRAIDGTAGRMKPSTSTCQSYVVCRELSPAGKPRPLPELLRTFNGGPDCHIWEAGLATSAALTFFDAATIAIGNPPTNRQFVDGGFGFNNPISTFDAVERANFPSSATRRCYVSIGTGKPTRADEAQARHWWRFWSRFQGVTALGLLKDVATDTECAHAFFERDARGRSDVAYFRFNCGRGLADIDLDEHRKLGQIQQLTNEYLQNTRTAAKIIRLSAILTYT